jgi:hypothetical protein
MASYNNLPMKPIERKAIAKIPAKTPGPKIATKSRAQINELIDLEATITNSATGLTTATLGVVLLAAKKAIGTAITKPKRVPKVAMLMVSHKGHQRLFNEFQAGGIMREPMSMNCVGASVIKAQMVSWVMTWKVQLTKAKIKTHAIKAPISYWLDLLRQ